MNRIDSNQSRHSRRINPSHGESPLAIAQRRLTNGVNAGTITAAEAAPLQARLDRLQTPGVTDGFDRHPGRRPQRELRGLRGQINAAARNAEVDVTVMATSLEKRITAGLENGTLTSAEGDSLRARASTLQARAQAAATPEEKASIGRSFLELRTAVHAARHDASFDVTNRKAALEARVAAGAGDGSLTVDEATRLRARMAGLSSTSGGDAFERLERAVSAQRHDRQVNVPVMGAALSTRIAALETSGLLPRTLADMARVALAELMQPGAKNVAEGLAALRAQLDTVPA